MTVLLLVIVAYVIGLGRGDDAIPLWATTLAMAGMGVLAGVVDIRLRERSR